jgi:hypothetical protein
MPFRHTTPHWFRIGLHRYKRRRQGRPPLPEGEKRSLRCVFWRGDEWDEAGRLAKEAGMTKSGYIRLMVLGEEWIEANKREKADKIRYDKKAKLKVKSISRPAASTYIERESLVSLCGSLPSEQP